MVHHVVGHGAQALDRLDEYLIVEQSILKTRLLGAPSLFASFRRLGSLRSFERLVRLFVPLPLLRDLRLIMSVNDPFRRGIPHQCMVAGDSLQGCDLSVLVCQRVVRLPLDLQVYVRAREIVQAPMEVQIQEPLGAVMRFDGHLVLLQILPVIL